MATLLRHSIEEDFAAWADETADLLEQRRFDELDVADLVEEVRGLARSLFHALQSQLQRLLMHLMKWAYQPSERSPSWETSILDARDKIERRLDESPSLRSKLTAKTIERSWRYARKIAALQTRLPLDTLPEVCPWDMDNHILNPDWLP